MKVREGQLEKIQVLRISKLIQPPRAVSQLDKRRQSTLLSLSLLILFFVGLIICLSYIVSNQIYNPTGRLGFFLTIIGTFLLFFTYLLNKLNYYIVSAFFLIFFISSLIHFEYIIESQLVLSTINYQFYCSILIVPILLSFILLDKKYVFAAFIINLVALLAIIFSHSNIDFANTVILDDLFLFSFTSLLIVFSSFHFEKLERDKKTDLDNINAQVIDLNEHLEDKIKERTSEIQSLLWLKDEFINQLGHDLKNPLTPLVSLLPVLEKNEHDPKNKEIIGVLIRNVSYMKNLVTKTIELGRLNSPNTKFNFEDINLLTELNNVINNNKMTLNEKHIEVKNNLPDNIIVKADKLRIDELITNLLNNAVNYTKGPGTITIDAKQDNDSVTVSMKDTGIGMSNEQLNKVFSEFYKADSSRHDFDSSGLGLSICKRIVEKHNGKIWVESEGLGKGSTFYFTVLKSKLKKESESREYIYHEIDSMYIKKLKLEK
jgi:signal transduction histidine kinase